MSVPCPSATSSLQCVKHTHTHSAKANCTMEDLMIKNASKLRGRMNASCYEGVGGGRPEGEVGVTAVCKERATASEEYAALAAAL